MLFLRGPTPPSDRVKGCLGGVWPRVWPQCRLSPVCPRAADPLGDCGGAPWEVFTDAAPEGSGFRVGVVGEKGFYRSMRCPPWVSSLQQAELFAVYMVAKLATYRGHASVGIGSDSNVARS